MVWFTKVREDSPNRVELRCDRTQGAYLLTVVSADGSETRTTFDDEDDMIAQAVATQIDLESRGWSVAPSMSSALRHPAPSKIPARIQDRSSGRVH